MYQNSFLSRLIERKSDKKFKRQDFFIYISICYITLLYQKTTETRKKGYFLFKKIKNSIVFLFYPQ